MSRYRNQAKRVIDHICTSNQMTEDKVKELFGLSVEMIDNRIEMIHLKTGKNGKQCADMLIQSWEDMKMFLIRYEARKKDIQKRWNERNQRMKQNNISL